MKEKLDVIICCSIVIFQTSELCRAVPPSPAGMPRVAPLVQMPDRQVFFGPNGNDQNLRMVVPHPPAAPLNYGPPVVPANVVNPPVQAMQFQAMPVVPAAQAQANVVNPPARDGVCVPPPFPPPAALVPLNLNDADFNFSDDEDVVVID